MDRIKIFAIVAVIALLAAGAAAVVAMTNGGEDKEEHTVTDALGRDVTITSVDRITSVSACPTAILCGLGVSSDLVAVSSDSGILNEDPRIIGLTDDDFPVSVADGIADGTITALGPMWGMSAETIVSVETDLVVFGGYGYNQATLDALDSLGVTYIVTYNESSIDDIYNNITLIGEAVGRSQEAEALVSEMQYVIGKITDWCESIVENERGGEKYDVALMLSSTYAVGGDYLSGRMLESLCASNVYQDVGMYAEVTMESMAQEDPDTIVFLSIGMGDGLDDPDAYIESMYTDPVLGGIRASQEQRISGATGAAKNVMTYADQGIVGAYAMCAMFIYADYLDFEVPTVLGTDDYYGYLSMFWEVVNS